MPSKIANVYLMFFFLLNFFFVLDKVELKRKRLKTGNNLDLFDISPNDGRKFSFSYFIIFIYFIYTYYFIWWWVNLAKFSKNRKNLWLCSFLQTHMSLSKSVVWSVLSQLLSHLIKAKKVKLFFKNVPMLTQVLFDCNI